MLGHLLQVRRTRGCVDDIWTGSEQLDPAWATAEGVQEPTEAEYYRALEKGLATTAEQEMVLRILAWWRRNDAFRDAPQPPAKGIPNGPWPWRENLKALAHLLDAGDDNDRIMKAEVLRELGEFEAAKQVLSRILSSDLAAAVLLLRSLCDSEDSCVREWRSGA